MRLLLLSVLVDTSSWIELLREGGRRKIADRVELLYTDGRACINEIILLELWNGARGEYEKRLIEEIQETATILPINSSVWEVAYALSVQARDAGNTVPITDLLVFATAAHYKVSVDHCDQHFEMLDKLSRLQKSI